MQPDLNAQAAAALDTSSSFWGDIVETVDNVLTPEAMVNWRALANETGYWGGKAMPYPIKKCRTETLAEGTWKKVVGRTVVIQCPICHKSACITGDSHKVAADGVVTPSVVCPYPGCTFHEHVKLEDWKEGG